MEAKREAVLKLTLFFCKTNVTERVLIPFMHTCILLTQW